MKRRRAGPRGFTLIELMIALVVSSLLVGMILAIFLRISIAYRGQQQVAEVQGKLAAARAKLELDAKQAGHAMANGFHVADGSGLLRSPLRVFNHADAPDELALYHADASAQGAWRGAGTCTWEQCDALDLTEGFAIGDVVVASTPGDDPASPYYPGEAKVVTFEACLLQISSLGPGSLGFSTAAPWGIPGNTHCPGSPTIRTMFYKLGGGHWRIDPSRPADGVLQLSRRGSLVGEDDWQDQGYGFTDLQIATRFFEPIDLIDDTPDPDADPQRDWYSGARQAELTRPSLELKEAPIQVSISLVARTERDVEGLATSATPELTVPGNEEHNTIGDRAAIPLPSLIPSLTGHRIYRHATFQVDLRNLGIGR